MTPHHSRGRDYFTTPRLIAVVGALALAGCSPPDRAFAAELEAEGVLQAALAQRCLAELPEGPRSTQFNDWDEVVFACNRVAEVQARECHSARLCLRVLFPDLQERMK